MPLTQIRVGAPSNVSATDGNAYDQLGGKSTEAIVAELHGKYYTQVYRGNCFMVSTIAAGLAIPIFSTTAPTVSLWNPIGSGKNAVLLRYTACNTLVTSPTVPGSVFLMALFNAGSVIASGSLVTAFNQSALGTNLFNSNLGGGNASVMKSSANGTNTITAQTQVVACMGCNAPSTTAGAVAAMGGVPIIYDFDGTVIVPPGVLVYAAASAASGTLFTQSLSWEEVPV